MSGKYGTRILTKLLNIEGVKVNSYRQHEGIGIILQVELLSKESICPRCGNKSHRVHQNHRYLVKDLPLSGQAVYLEINRRQFKCDICQKPFSEELSFFRRKRNFTSRLADSIVKEVLENDIHSVAKKSHVTTEEIERILKDKAEELLASKPCGLKRLGIDEIALIKGHGHYCAVLIDLDTSKLIAILSGRTQEVIKETLVEWVTEVLEQIEEVSIDLWKGYKNLVVELMPNAQVVADRFHVTHFVWRGGQPSYDSRLFSRLIVGLLRLPSSLGRPSVMTQINKELDTQRKKEKRSYENLIKQEKLRSQKNEYEQILSGIKNSKYSLLKNEDNLNEEQLQKLLQVKDVSPILKEMHELKEKIIKIFNQTHDWYTGVFKLGRGLSRAKKYFPNSYNTIIRWFDEIIAYFDNGTTNGAVEGINNKLKLIKRSAYGFRNFDNFRIRCLLNWQFNC